ncbi:MAG: N-acetylmuramoyl-L-alanine amidase [Lachnospiraceae bacterium]|nr:N-acetylmuramoyl-L-alanine amidase [Lachnospiraceae bacterium]
MKKIRKVTVHAGHNPSGKIACGASDLLDESTQARYVAKKVIKLLRKNGIKAVNCTVNNGINQSDVLRKICVKCNDVTDADLHISIHFNSGRSDRKGDGRTGGTEVLLTENVADKGDIAKRICNQMAKLGFTNRGVKINKNLYFLNHTKAPAILAEVCFVDDKDDYMLYTSDRDAVAEAIVRAVVKHNKAYIV